MQIRLLLVPYDSGQRSVRMGAGPEHLVNSGLKEHLAANGHDVELETIEPASSHWRAEVQTSFELMRAIGKHIREAREARRFPIVLAGNCSAAIGALGGLGAQTGVVWLDAHGDFNTPQTTMSGFLDGMTLATATGRCWAEMARSVEGFEPVPDEAVLLLGARDLDPGEEAALARSKVVRLGAEAALIGIHPVLQTLAQEMPQFYLHLDLDALDPAEGRANSYSARGGFSNADLQILLSAIAKTLPIKALTIAGYDPSYDKDGAVCRIALQSTATIATALEQREVLT